MSDVMVQCSSWNGNTNPLRVESGGDLSAVIVLLIKYEYALSDSRQWPEQVSLDGATNEMELRTA